MKAIPFTIFHPDFVKFQTKPPKAGFKALKLRCTSEANQHERVSKFPRLRSQRGGCAIPDFFWPSSGKNLTGWSKGYTRVPLYFYYLLWYALFSLSVPHVTVLPPPYSRQRTWKSALGDFWTFLHGTQDWDEKQNETETETKGPNYVMTNLQLVFLLFFKSVVLLHYDSKEIKGLIISFPPFFFFGSLNQPSGCHFGHLVLQLMCHKSCQEIKSKRPEYWKSSAALCKQAEVL